MLDTIRGARMWVCQEQPLTGSGPSAWAAAGVSCRREGGAAWQRRGEAGCAYRLLGGLRCTVRPCSRRATI